MKKQTKSSLFAAMVGLSLLSAVLISAGDDTTLPDAYQQHGSEALQTITPAASSTPAKPSKLPVTFYLKLISRMANGGSIDANIFIPERPATIWEENSEWTPEH